MIGILLAASLAAPAMVRPGEQPAYEAYLRKAAVTAAGNFRGSPCPVEAKAEVLADRAWVLEADWRVERVKVTGCGADTLQNIEVQRGDGDTPWESAALLPGESQAKPGLQKEAFKNALDVASADLKEGCQGVKVEDAYIAARPGGLYFMRPGETEPPAGKGRIGISAPANADALDVTAAWVEVWPLTMCGEDRTVGVVFIPIKGSTSVAYNFMPIWRAGGGPDSRPAHAP